MEAMELTKLLTRLPMEAQYLEERVQPYWGKVQKGGCGGGLRQKLCLLAMNQNDPVAGLQCYRGIMILVLLLILSYLI